MRPSQGIAMLRCYVGLFFSLEHPTENLWLLYLRSSLPLLISRVNRQPCNTLPKTLKDPQQRHLHRTEHPKPHLSTGNGHSDLNKTAVVGQVLIYLQRDHDGKRYYTLVMCTSILPAISIVLVVLFLVQQISMCRIL